MKKNTKTLIIISIIIIGFNQLFYGEALDLFSLTSGPMKYNDLRNLAPWIFNYLLFAAYFFGHFKRDFTQKGYLLVVKSKSTSIWLNQRLKKMLIDVLVIIGLTQCMNFLLNHQLGTETFDVMTYVGAISLYGLGMVCLLQLQAMFEILVDEERAFLIVSGFTIVTTILGGLLYESNQWLWLLYLLIPNMSMSYRSNILDPQAVGLNPMLSVIVLVVLNGGIYMCLKNVTRKKEII